MLAAHAGAIVAVIGDFVKRHREHLWTGFLLALVGWSAYNLGLVRAQSGARPLQEAGVFRAGDSPVSPSPSAKQGSTKSAIDKSDTRVVVSKTSTSRKYHHSWCAGAKQIKEANRVWFPTEQAAIDAGYSLAGNCQP